jgi:hypothetical protein
MLFIAMERARRRFAERVAAPGRVVNPVAKGRWNQTYKLARYDLTQELFDRLLGDPAVRLRDVSHSVRGRAGHLHKPRPWLLPG